MSTQTIETTQVDDKINEGIGYYLENSTIKSNGIREIPDKAFHKRLETAHGVSKETIKQVQDAINYETTVAAHVALAGVEELIGAASADDLENEDYRRKLSSTVRLPTLGGSTEVTQYVEDVNRVPNQLNDDGTPKLKVTYGRVRTTINAKGRIDKSFHDVACDRIKNALKIKD